jgi:hypothetical protein
VDMALSGARTAEHAQEEGYFTEAIIKKLILFMMRFSAIFIFLLQKSGGKMRMMRI